MAKAKSGGSKATADMVSAWAGGAHEGDTENHKAIGESGYRIGLHEGMRYVVAMLDDGVPIEQIIDRCRARITSHKGKPADEAAAYWQARQSTARSD